MALQGQNNSCEWFYEEPEECRKCLLLGYQFNCGSKQCLEARKRELHEETRASYRISHRKQGVQ